MPSKTNRISILSVLFYGSLLVLTGCAGSLSKEKAHHISTVAVNNEVTFGNSASNHTSGKAMAGAFGGIVGSLIASAASADEDQELTEIFRAATQLELVTTDCLKQAIRENPYWSNRLVEDKQSADAVFDIHIYDYGFSTSLFQTAQPILGLVVSLTDKDGKELWKAGRFVAKHPDNLPRYKLAEYLEDMSRYDTAAASLCKDLMVQLIDDEK